MASRRVISNPVLKDKITFLKTAEETNGEYTLLEMELAPGGGNALHYHKHFTEKFTALEGQLGLELAEQTHLLEPGQSALAPVNVPHRFFNQSDTTTLSTVELRPGQPNFERMLQISYGLASEGKANSNGVPKNLFYTALLFQLADTHAPGFLFKTAATPLLNLLAKLAKKRRLDHHFSRYVQD